VAWVQKGDLETDAPRLDTAGMLTLSKRFLGLPYTWGGSSSFGYDCSGFTQMLERRRGVLMPRDAHEQEAWTGVAAVERENLEPGDLLFFGADAGEITHTGMYIGADEFIHATAHERPVIQISRLTDPHWTKVFLSARRVR
jgi:gamma-D-glutamyl-L-lysine dipeptidyl-peptidase